MPPLLSEFVRKTKPSDQNERFFAWGLNLERFDSSHTAVPQRFYISDEFTGLGFIEAYAQRIFILSPAEDILAGFQRKGFQPDRHLRQKEVRIFSFRRVAGGNQDHSGNEFPLAVRDPG